VIGIIAAMTLERQAIQELLEQPQSIDYFGQTFRQGRLSGKPVILAESGVGKVAAAVTTARLIEHFGCTVILNCGTAGGLLSQQRILDIVVADRLTYHDWDQESMDGQPRGFAHNRYVFRADPQLVRKAGQAARQVGGDHAVFIGPVVSGDVFVSDPRLVESIKKSFPEAVACDVESCAVGQVCTAYQVPFVILRSLSDIVIRQGNTLDFDRYCQQASRISAGFVQAWLKQPE
jgi:adenosylhomocysteine nucleosidase